MLRGRYASTSISRDRIPGIQHRRVEIINRLPIVSAFVAELIGRSTDLAAFNAASGEPHGKSKVDI